MPRARAGFSLVELSVVLVIAGIFALAAVPRTGRAVETATVDRGAGTLRTIWLAERMYRLEHGRYAEELGALVAEGFLDEEIAAAEQPFRYRIRRILPEGPVIEGRRNGGGWYGRIELGPRGELRGGTERSGGDRVAVP